MPPPGGRSRRGLTTALLFTVGCGTNDVVAPAPDAPVLLASTAAGNQHNVLSAVVTASIRFADSVAVRYGLSGGALDSLTPAVTVVADSAVVPVLGLMAERAYLLRLEVYGGKQTLLGDSLRYSTGALPADLPRYTTSGPDPSPGYVVFAAGQYGVVIDNSGRVVWYHHFPNGPGLNFMAQSTGHYVARPPTQDPTDREPWLVIDVLGNVTRAFGCARGLQPRFHDLIAELDGSYWVLCDETRTIDLSTLGGVANASVTGTVVQHLDDHGNLLFQWSPFDHFAISDLDSASRAGPTVNWTHGNALDLDSDGNLVASFRNLGEITKIDTRTGAVMWRMGGLRNQFTFLDAPTPSFSRQHGMRLAGPGGLVLLDNLGDPAASRAERYRYDAGLRTARLMGSYGPSSPVTALLGGSAQDLPSGRTLVSFGTAGRVQEYDASGRVVWQIDGNPGYVFRAQRIRSLYHPGIGTPR